MIEYWRNALGFFIQLFPCALLFVITLDQDNLKYERKRIIIFLGMVIMVLALIFPIVMWASCPAFVTARQFGNIYMLFAVMIMFILIKFFSYEDKTKKILITCLVLFYATTQYMIANFLCCYFPSRSIGDALEVYNYLMFWLFLIEAILTLPPTYLFMKNVVAPHLKDSSLVDLKREFKFSIIFTLLYFIFLIIVMSSNSLLYHGVWINELGVIITSLSIICIIAFAFNFWNLFYELRRIREENLIKNQIMLQDVQYQKINKEIENSKQFRHDLRHHMRTLQNLISNNDNQKALDYIGTFINEKQSFGEFDYCRNFTINTLLNYYLNWAQSEGIAYEVQAHCSELSIAATDLTVILGNCLENAILACRRTKSKKIILKMGIVKKTFAISLINSCEEIKLVKDQEISDDFISINNFVSIRSSGYGLTSIENTVAKYGGSIKCRYDQSSQEFTTRIILNLDN